MCAWVGVSAVCLVGMVIELEREGEIYCARVGVVARLC